MDRNAAINELSEIYDELYENEQDPEPDMDGARQYWRLLPSDQLLAELNEAREKLKSYRA